MLIGSIRYHLKLSVPAMVILIGLSLLSVFGTDHFLTTGNIINIANNAAPLALVALAEALVLITAGIDLSVGMVMGLATVLMSLYSNELGVFAIPLVLLCGAVIGSLNGLGSIYLKIHPLIMTLATMSMIRGVGLFLLPSPGGEVDYRFYEWLFEYEKVFGPPLAIVLLLYGAAFVTLHYTRAGRFLYAMGSDYQSAYTGGLSLNRIILVTYTLSGTLAAGAGVLLSIRILSGDALIGDPFTLDAITAAILGGFALQGGRGSVVGALLGCFVLILMNNSLNLFGVSSYAQYAVKGAILLGALLLLSRGKSGDIIR